MRILFLISIGLFALSFLIPNHYRPWTSAYHEFAAFAAGLFAVLALLSYRPSLRFKLPLVAVFLYVLCCIPWMQYSAGIIFFGGDALSSSLYLLGFAVMLTAGYNLARANSFGSVCVLWLSSVLVFCAVVSAFLALYQWTLQPGSIWITSLVRNSRPYANFAQPNQLATLLGMGLAGALFFYEKHILHRISSSLLVLILLFGLALTQSRTGWLMPLFFIVLWMWKYNAASCRLSRRWALIWVAVFLGFVLVLPYLTQWLLLGEGVSVAQRVQSMSRWHLYTQFFQAILQGPVWGYGWQQASTAQLAVAPFFEKLLYTKYTHNIFLDLLIWNGPILGGLIISIVGFYLVRLAFLSNSTESIFLVLAVGVFLLHSLFEYPHAYAYFLLPAGLMIGCLQAQLVCREYSLPRWPVFVFLLASIPLYATIWYEYRVIEEDYRLMRFEKNRVGTLKAAQPAPDVVFLTQLHALLKHSRLPATTGMTPDELEELYQFSRRFTHPAALFKYAQALFLNGQPDEAAQQLLLIKNLHGERMIRSAVEVLKNTAEDYPDPEVLMDKIQLYNQE